jgi:hypothetical protein
MNYVLVDNRVLVMIKISRPPFGMYANPWNLTHTHACCLGLKNKTPQFIAGFYFESGEGGIRIILQTLAIPMYLRVDENYLPVFLPSKLKD